MMFKKGYASELCVLQVSTDILRLPGIVLTDQNASATSRACWRRTSGAASTLTTFSPTIGATRMIPSRCTDTGRANAPRFWCRASACELLDRAYVVDDQAAQALTDHASVYPYG
jgi:hypothetical protein